MKAIFGFLVAALLLGSAHADPIGSAIGGAAGTQSSLGGGLCLTSPTPLVNGQQAGFLIDCATHALLTLPAGGATVVVPMITDTSTDISGAVILGGTYQTVAAANPTRKNCTIQNPTTASEVLNVKLGTMAQPFTLLAGGVFKSLSGNLSSTDAITVTATTNGHVWAGACQN